MQPAALLGGGVATSPGGWFKKASELYFSGLRHLTLGVQGASSPAANIGPANSDPCVWSVGSDGSDGTGSWAKETGRCGAVRHVAAYCPGTALGATF